MNLWHSTFRHNIRLLETMTFDHCLKTVEVDQSNMGSEVKKGSRGFIIFDMTSETNAGIIITNDLIDQRNRINETSKRDEYDRNDQCETY